MEQTQFSITCVDCQIPAKLSLETDFDIARNLYLAAVVLCCPQCGAMVRQSAEYPKRDMLRREADPEVKAAIEEAMG